VVVTTEVKISGHLKCLNWESILCVPRNVYRNLKINMSLVMKERYKNNPTSVYSRTTKGWREFYDGKRYYFKSKWEMNYAKYLSWLKQKREIKDWWYEKDTFWFKGIKRGVMSYTPDFKILENNKKIKYHEVKGWMDSKSKTKLKRMKKYYPEIELILIEEDEYNAVKKMGRLFGFE
jgi:predicted nuclease of restriction endonuclease-like RecB superfamily